MYIFGYLAKDGSVLPLSDTPDISKTLDRFKIIEKTIIPRPRKEIIISTVFLGVNHGPVNTPLWFETMVFGGKCDGIVERYETIIEARKGHDKIVQHVLKKEK